MTGILSIPGIAVTSILNNPGNPSAAAEEFRDRWSDPEERFDASFGQLRSAASRAYAIATWPILEPFLTQLSYLGAFAAVCILYPDVCKDILARLTIVCFTDDNCPETIGRLPSLRRKAGQLYSPQ